MSERYAELRELLAGEPSVGGFEAIVEMFRRWPEGEERQGALGYALEHLGDWPEHACQWSASGLLPGVVLQLTPDRPEDLADCLERCHEAVDSQRWEQALDWALAAWKRCHRVEVARLVRQLDDRLPTPMAWDRKQLHPQWMALAAQKDVRQLGALWKTVARDCTHKEARKRLDQLAGWSDDPRAAEAILEAFHAPPWSNARSPFWTGLFQRVSENTDPRLRQLPDAILAQGFYPDIEEKMLSRAYRALHKRLQVGEGTPLTEGESAWVEAIEAALSQSDAQSTELWDAVYADLEDLDARRALAQWLAERDDPRGLWMQLSWKKKRSPQERALYKELHAQHGRSWLGPLESLVLKGEVYQDGLLSKLKLKRGSSRGLQRAKESRLWSSVEEVECFAESVEALLQSRHLHSLRHLQLKFSHGCPQALELFAQLSGLESFAALESISIELRTSTVAPSQLLGPLLLMFQDAALQVLELSSEYGFGNFRLQRDPEGAFSRLEVLEILHDEAFVPVLWRVPDDLFVEIALPEYSARIEAPLAYHQALERLWFRGEERVAPQKKPPVWSRPQEAQSLEDVLAHWYGEAPPREPQANGMLALRWLQQQAPDVLWCSAAASFDGRHLAGCDGQHLYFFDRHSQREVERIESRASHISAGESGLLLDVRHDVHMETVLWSSPGQLQALLPMREPGHPLYGHASFALHPKERRFAFRLRGQIWYCHQPQARPRLLLEAAHLDGLFFSPSGRWLVACSWGESRLWDTEASPKPLAHSLPEALPFHQGHMAFVDDDTLLFSRGSRLIQLHLPSGQLRAVQVRPSCELQGLHLSPDKQLVASEVFMHQPGGSVGLYDRDSGWQVGLV